MTTATTTKPTTTTKAWAGFKGEDWKKNIDVRDFIQKNYKPYDGDESFLATATPRTAEMWKYLDDNYLPSKGNSASTTWTPTRPQESTPSNQATSRTKRPTT